MRVWKRIGIIKSSSMANCVTQSTIFAVINPFLPLHENLKYPVLLLAFWFFRLPKPHKVLNRFLVFVHQDTLLQIVPKAILHNPMPTSQGFGDFVIELILSTFVSIDCHKKGNRQKFYRFKWFFHIISQVILYKMFTS